MILNRMEEVKLKEKEVLAAMTSELYEKTRIMGGLQHEIEEINSKNQCLEQDFENEISKKNESQKEMEMIESSIDNIFQICNKVKAEQRRGVITNLDRQGEKEPKNDVIIDNLIRKLKESVVTVGDLSSLLKNLPQECTLERYYEE